MFIGNECYVTRPYDERVLKIFLERDLTKKAKTPERGLIEQCISALMACKDDPVLKSQMSVHISQMEHNLSQLGISYHDFRSNKKSEGNPADAVEAFNSICAERNC